MVHRCIRLCALASLLACSPSGDLQPMQVAPPEISGIFETVVAVGDPMEFAGSGFVAPEEGWVDVRFVGTYFPDDGSAPNPVDFAVPLQVGADGLLVWERFGGYKIPFSITGDQLGYFDGTVFATNQYFDETRAPVEQPERTRVATTIVMLPSLVVLDHRAFGDTFVADCAEPATNLIEMVRYGFRVKAVGFEPTRWYFALSPGLVVGDEVQTDTTEFSRAPTARASTGSSPSGRRCRTT